MFYCEFGRQIMLRHVIYLRHVKFRPAIQKCDPFADKMNIQSHTTTIIKQ